MSDNHWLSAMAKFKGDWSTDRDGKFLGGAIELSRGLQRLVNEDPARFSNLSERMDATLPAVYFEAILEGLTDQANDIDRTGSLEQVCFVLRRIAVLGIPASGKVIARAIETLSEEDIPNDIIQMLCNISLNDPDPEEDDRQDYGDPVAPITQAINSARGEAARALAKLLFADKSRWDILKPAIVKLVEDPTLAVRSVVGQLFASYP